MSLLRFLLAMILWKEPSMSRRSIIPINRVWGHKLGKTAAFIRLCPEATRVLFENVVSLRSPVQCLVMEAEPCPRGERVPLELPGASGWPQVCHRRLACSR